MSWPPSPPAPAAPPSAPVPALPGKPLIALKIVRSLAAEQRLPPPLPPLTAFAPHVRSPALAYWRFLPELHSTTGGPANPAYSVSYGAGADTTRPVPSTPGAPLTPD